MNKKLHYLFLKLSNTSLNNKTSTFKNRSQQSLILYFSTVTGCREISFIFLLFSQLHHFPQYIFE